jgi:two-component sensor histidine kinase
MKRLIPFLLMFCLQMPALLPAQVFTEQLDTILASPHDTDQLGGLNDFLSGLINAGEIIPDTLFDLVLKLAEELEDPPGLALFYSNRSVYELNTGKVDQGLVNIEEAIKYAIAGKENDLLANSYGLKVHLLMANGDTKESAELASALAKKYHEAGDLYREAEAYLMLSSLSSSVGNHELTVQYDSTAIALARESKYVGILASALCTAAENLNYLDYPEKGLILAEEALALAELNELDFIEIGNILSARAVANTALGNYNEALRDHDALKDWEGDQQFTWLMTSKGILLQRMGRHDEARELLLDAVSSLKRGSNDPLELERCYQALQTVGLNQTEYDTVSYYGKLMEAEQDSMQIAKNVKSLLELEKKYKTQEKEAEIDRQKEQLVLQRTQLYAMIFVFLLASMIGVSFYLLSQRLRKTNLENEQLLRDKETLIGEIHHRVKNNLQVVSSLLQLQRSGLDSDDEKGREALHASQSRVNAMGLIHNKLYQGEQVTTVYMPEYLEDLGETLVNAYRLEEQVEVFYDVEDISLDVDKAIPLGLIVNELITNSMKYAFPYGREGTIEIALHREKDHLLLIVHDNGVGAEAAEKRSDSTSFGSNLVGLLTQKLKGTLEKMEGRGYGVKISFVG